MWNGKILTKFYIKKINDVRLLSAFTAAASTSLHWALQPAAQRIIGYLVSSFVALSYT